ETGVSAEPMTPGMRHSSEVNCAEFSPDGGRIVSAASDGTARLWDAQSGKPLGVPMRHIALHVNYVVLCARFSPDGQRVVTGGQDTLARLWDGQTGQPLG